MFDSFRKSTACFILFFLVFGGFLNVFLAGQARAAGENWLSGYSYRKQITVRDDNIDSDLTDFPVLAVIDSGIAGKMVDTINWYDIRFTDSDGQTLLKHEKENMSVSGGNFWVKVPHAYATPTGNQNKIYVYYGKSGATDGSESTEVWDANFKGVWHLGDAGPTAVYDSTSNNKDGEKIGGVTFGATGKINSATSYDGSGDYLSVAGLSESQGTSNTGCTWVTMSNVTDVERRMLFETKINFPISLGWNNSSSQNAFDAWTGLPGTFAGVVSTTHPVVNTWYLVCSRVDVTTNKLAIFVNGEKQNEANIIFTVPAVSGLNIGTYRDADTRWMQGILDEIRISNSSRSDAWIKADYHSQNNNLLNFGVEENSAETTITNVATDVTFISARLNGEFNSMQEESSVYAWFKWRESGTEAWNETVKVEKDTIGTFYVDISDINIGTQYEFQAYTSALDGTKETNGSLLNFTTEQLSVQTNAATSITNDSARLNGEVLDSGGEASVKVWFEWREQGAGSWASTTKQTIESGTFYENLSDFSNNKTYEFRTIISTVNNQYEDIGATGTFIIRNHILVSPYESKTYQYKVSLHNHTTGSDGSYSPTWVMEHYRDLDFVAVAITDHNLVTADPNVSGIIRISGDELSNADGHIPTINTTSNISGTHQYQIDQTLAQGGLPYLGHPNVNPDGYGWTDAEMLGVNNYIGVEVFNSATQDSVTNAEDKVDYVLSHGREIWVIATSDFHNTPERLEGGFVVINTDISRDALTSDDVVSILQNGNYFSAGRLNTAMPFPPYFTDISTDGVTVTATTDKASKIEFITNNGTVSQTNNGVTEASYTASSDEVYVRIKATYTDSGNEAYAWSNPLYIEDGDNSAPILSITSPNSGDRISADDTITFTDSEETDPQCSLDNSNWVDCESGITSFSDLTGWGAIAENGTFTLYIKDTDAAGNIGTASVENLVKDTIAPTVTNVSSTTADGSYKEGSVINVRATFSEAVTITGTPRIKLQTNNGNQYATYSAGTGSTNIDFSYSVQAGDTAVDLDYTATIALELNGGTIKDATGNSATLNLPAPGATHSLGDNQSLILDTTLPTLSNLSPNSLTLNVDTTSTTLTLTTDEITTCKYAAASGTSYATMTAFDTTDDTTHATLVTGLASGGSYHYYVLCRDSAANESTEAHLTFQIAPEENKTSLNSIKVKINRAFNKFKDQIKLAQNKFKLKGKDTQLAGGEVRIYKDGKRIKTVDVGSDGGWSQILKLKDGFSGTIKVRQYDQYGTLLNTKKVKLEVDTEKPEFNSFFLPWRATRELTKLNFQAKDNDQVKKYKIYVGGKIYTTKYATWQIPREAPTGLQEIKVRVYDEAGNTALKSGHVWVR